MLSFGGHTFVPMSWACKKQTAVSHSSTEAEVISLDTGQRIEGLFAFLLWYDVTDVSEPPASQARGDPSCQLKPKTLTVRQGSSDDVPPNALESSNRAHLYIYDDIGAVINDDNQGQEPAHASCFADASCQLGLAFLEDPFDLEHFQ